jgi:transposase-like protein
MGRREPEKAKHWEAIFTEQASSEMSIAAFCRERDIRPTQYYWWRRRLKSDKSQSDATEGFIELLSASGHTSTSSSGIKLIYDNRFSLQLDPGFDPTTLKQVLAVLTEHLQ